MSQIVTPKVVALNINSSGDNTVVTHGTFGAIKVWQMSFTAAGAVNVVFKNGAAAQSGAYALTGAGSALTFQYTGMPWSWADAGLDWIINLSGATAITGQIFYTIGD